MNAEPRQAGVEVSVLDGWTADSGVDMVIEQAWLPMVILDGVKVTIEAREGISVMERFVLEALLQLQKLEVGELQEIASIPTELGSWLLASLQQKGLVHRVGSGFAPDIERCNAVLESGLLPVEREEQRDLLWFPETDEVVVLDSATRLLRKLRKLKPSGRWPVPQGWWGKTRAACLSEPLEKGRFYSVDGSAIARILDEAVIAQVQSEGEKKTAPTFPAYICSSTISLADAASGWSLDVGEKRAKIDDQQAPEMLSLKPAVPRLSHLIAAWQQRMMDARAAIESELQREHKFSVLLDGSGGYAASLKEADARAFAENGLLSESYGLQVRIDDEFEAIVPLRCRSADDGAERIFAVDRAIRGLLSASRVDPEWDGVGRQDVINRLWKLRLYKPLYDLREPSDFAA